MSRLNMLPNKNPVEPQIPARVDYWLTQWARYMRHPGMRLGYPARSLCFTGGGESQRWADWADDEEERIWLRSVRAVDAAIADLTPDQRMAVCHVYLGQVTALENIFGLLESAAQALLAAMQRRNI